MKPTIKLPQKCPALFISSQIEVFRKERKILADWIENELRMEAFRFEGIARPHPPRTIYKAYLEQADFFIGIYGSGYGWVDQEGGMEISGLHDEWRLATKSNKPRIVFVENVPKREPLLEKLINEEISNEVSYVTFNTSEELIELVKNSVRDLVKQYIHAGLNRSETKLPDYTNHLLEKYKDKEMLETSFFKEKLCPAVDQSKKIFVYGKPGSGKTVSLMMIAKAKSSIYISARHRSSLYILTYLANQALNIQNKTTENYATKEEAIFKLESVIDDSEFIFVVDDLELSEELVNTLLSINLGNSKIIICSRVLFANIGPDVISLECYGFETLEAQAYVSKYIPDCEPKLISEAVKKSGCNPQYLSFFCESPDETLGDSLETYHSRMYEKLPDTSQEILAILSLSETELNIDDIAEAIGVYRSQSVTSIAIKKELDGINFLIDLNEGVVSIFHPAFAEYVYSHIINLGLEKVIHKSLAAIYKTPGEMFLRVYHMLLAGEAIKVNDEIPDAATTAYMSGFIRIARVLFVNVIISARNEKNYSLLAYGLHHVAILKKDIYGERAALRTIGLAEKFFIIAKEDEWVKMIQAIKATFLVGLGRGEEAVSVLKELAEHYRDNGLTRREAVIRTNLSFVYAKIGYFEELEKECQRAKELHESLNDKYGLAICLLNLNNLYIANREDVLLLKTCRELQKLSEELNVPRLEAAAQNGLTAYFRRKGQYDKAHKSAERSISIARELGDWDCIATNLGNLGNVYRDEGENEKAKQCYKEIEEIAIKRKSTHHIAHAKRSLAELAEIEGDEELAFDLGLEALALWEKVGNKYRIATDCINHAERIIKFRGFDWKDAVPYFIRSASLYFSIGLLKDAFQTYCQLIEVHLNHFERYEANEIFEEALGKFAVPEKSRYICGLLESLLRWDKKSKSYIDPSGIISKSCECLSPTLSKSELFELIRHCTSAIKHINKDVANVFSMLINAILDFYKISNGEHFIAAIAIAFEQISPDFDLEQLTVLFKCIAGVDDNIIYRHEHWLDDQWLLLFDADKSPILEIRSGNTVEERVAAIVSILLVYRQKEMLEKIITSHGWKRIGLILHTLNGKDLKSNNIKSPNFSNDCPVQIPVYTKDEYRDGKFTPLLVSEKYLEQADYISNPDSRSIISHNMQLVTEVIAHFTKEICPEKYLKKYRNTSTLKIFDVELQ